MKASARVKKIEEPSCLTALDFKLLKERVGAEAALRVLYRSLARQKEEEMKRITH